MEEKKTNTKPRIWLAGLICAALMTPAKASATQSTPGAAIRIRFASRPMANAIITNVMAEKNRVATVTDLLRTSCRRSLRAIATIAIASSTDGLRYTPQLTAVDLEHSVGQALAAGVVVGGYQHGAAALLGFRQRLIDEALTRFVERGVGFIQ